MIVHLRLSEIVIVIDTQIRQRFNLRNLLGFLEII